MTIDVVCCVYVSREVLSLMMIDHVCRVYLSGEMMATTDGVDLNLDGNHHLSYQ